MVEENVTLVVKAVRETVAKGSMEELTVKVCFVRFCFEEKDWNALTWGWMDGWISPC